MEMYEIPHPNLRDVCLLEATILCAEGERRSLNLDLVALNTAAGMKFDDKPSGLRDFTELKSVENETGFGTMACRFVFPATQIAVDYSAVFRIVFVDISLKNLTILPEMCQRSFSFRMHGTYPMA